MILRLAAIFAAVTLLAAEGHAHGGQYQGPGPADAAMPAPTTNPPTGAPSSGGSGSQKSGGSAAPAVPSGSGPAVRSVRGSGRRGRASTNAPASTALVAWEFWWEANKDRFLSLKSRLGSPPVVAGSVASLTGRGGGLATLGTRPTRDQVDAQLVPFLVELLETAEDRDILDSIVIALGRMSSENLAAPVLDAATPLLSHHERSVRTSAALTLGVLGSPAASQLLRDVLADNSAGRRVTGGGEIDWLVRAFAALALGMIGDDPSVEALLDALNRLPDRHRDIRVCILVGLGQLGSGHPRAAEVQSRLGTLLLDEETDPVVASFAATSLGKLGHATSLPYLMTAFQGEITDHVVRQSCAIGLGRLASAADEEAVEALLEEVSDGHDAQTRHFAMIALADIGARDDRLSPRTTRTHEHIRRLLGKEIFAHGASRAHRSWSALAAGIYGRAHPDAAPMLIDRLRLAYAREHDPSYKGAYAVALGLLADRPSADALHADFRESRESSFRGYAAVALGFLRCTAAADELSALCRSKGATATLRLQCATALGLMGEVDAVPALIDGMRESQTTGVSAAIAKSLGLIGDSVAIGPLQDVAADESQQTLARAFACVALGLVGEKTDLPWNEPIRSHNNYRAVVPSIQEVLDIL